MPIQNTGLVSRSSYLLLCCVLYGFRSHVAWSNLQSSPYRGLCVQLDPLGLTHDHLFTSDGTLAWSMQPKGR
ncbi:hypothetical protein [Pasteuria penetrans]|uniref:hypothetical protein n=1 Tax=Pasteuria penetrans TaxID=86005 RepID=UPI0011ED02B9|nr:hypothetical protein [Pasteuria penetrans]